FGLACQPGGGELSQTGEVMGTPSYMPPEQARGERQSLGPPADVYSLGVVLYEALTGKPPFRAATPLETVHQVLNDEPAPPAAPPAPPPSGNRGPRAPRGLRPRPGPRPAAPPAGRPGEPPTARPAGAAERAWKWGRRKPAQAGLLAVSFLLVLAVIGIPT